MEHPNTRGDLVLELACGHSQVVLGLKIDPETGFHAEVDAQAQRSVGRDGPLAAHQDPSLRDALSHGRARSVRQKAAAAGAVGVRVGIDFCQQPARHSDIDLLGLALVARRVDLDHAPGPSRKPGVLLVHLHRRRRRDRPTVFGNRFQVRIDGFAGIVERFFQGISGRKA